MTRTVCMEMDQDIFLSMNRSPVELAEEMRLAAAVKKFLTRLEDAAKSPFHKGGFRGIFRCTLYSKSPLTPLWKRGE